MSETTPAPAPADEGSRRRGLRSRRRPAAEAPVEGAVSSQSGTKRAPDLNVPANRREIPLSAFDFLGDAYASAVRARRVMWVLLAGLLAFAGYLAYSTLQASAAADAAEAQLASISAQEEQVVASLGQGSTATNPRLVITRQLDLQKSLNLVAASQPSLQGLVQTLSQVQVPGVAITELRLGAPAVQSRGSATSLDPSKGVPFAVAASAADLLASSTWANQVRSLPGLIDVSIVQEGTSATLSGYIALGQPPAPLVERLLSLGVTYATPERPSSPSLPQTSASESPSPGASP